MNKENMQPAEPAGNRKLNAEVSTRRKDPIIIMNFNSVDGNMLVPQQYKVTRILKAKGLVNAGWAGVEAKPMKAEIMLK